MFSVFLGQTAGVNTTVQGFVGVFWPEITHTYISHVILFLKSLVSVFIFV